MSGHGAKLIRIKQVHQSKRFNCTQSNKIFPNQKKKFVNILTSFSINNAGIIRQSKKILLCSYQAKTRL